MILKNFFYILIYLKIVLCQDIVNCIIEYSVQGYCKDNNIKTIGKCEFRLPKFNNAYDYQGCVDRAGNFKEIIEKNGGITKENKQFKTLPYNYKIIDSGKCLENNNDCYENRAKNACEKQRSDLLKNGPGNYKSIITKCNNDIPQKGKYFGGKTCKCINNFIGQTRCPGSKNGYFKGCGNCHTYDNRLSGCSCGECSSCEDYTGTNNACRSVG
jgi:hypothetical protein